LPYDLGGFGIGLPNWDLVPTLIKNAISFVLSSRQEQDSYLEGLDFFVESSLSSRRLLLSEHIYDSFSGWKTIFLLERGLKAIPDESEKLARETIFGMVYDMPLYRSDIDDNFFTIVLENVWFQTRLVH
jgi:hypothetical protein